MNVQPINDKDDANDRRYAIICNGLVKSYGSQLAVENINLKVKYGSIFGLLGPNGAGKTSIIKMLTGLSNPTSGDAFVANHNIRHETIKVKQNIGWVSSEVILDESLTTLENIWIQSKLQGLDKRWKKKAIELLEYFELYEDKNKRTSHLSTGMKKKLEIIMALLHNPKILVMDEPTIGLDASTRKLLWRLIKRINKTQGVTILLTTHYIEEADTLCDDLAIINHGKIIATGSPTQLKAMAGGDTLEMEFFQKFDFSYIKNLHGIKSIVDVVEGDNEKEDNQGSSSKENGLELNAKKSLKLFIKVYNAETILPEIITKLSQNHPSNIKYIRIEKPNLETIFLDLTGRRIDDVEESKDKEIHIKTTKPR